MNYHYSEMMRKILSLPEIFPITMGYEIYRMVCVRMKTFYIGIFQAFTKSFCSIRNDSKKAHFSFWIEFIFLFKYLNEVVRTFRNLKLAKIYHVHQEHISHLGWWGYLYTYPRIYEYNDWLFFISGVGINIFIMKKFS